MNLDLHARGHGEIPDSGLIDRCAMCVELKVVQDACGPFLLLHTESLNGIGQNFVRTSAVIVAGA
jgi:hypothetical protein